VAGGVLTTEMVMRRLRSEAGEITYISTQENITEETVPMKEILIDPLLSNNPSRDNGWSGYITGNNSTQGGEL
jgi:hypothetical protein